MAGTSWRWFMSNRWTDERTDGQRPIAHESGARLTLKHRRLLWNMALRPQPLHRHRSHRSHLRTSACMHTCMNDRLQITASVSKARHRGWLPPPLPRTTHGRGLLPWSSATRQSWMVIDERVRFESSGEAALTSLVNVEMRCVKQRSRNCLRTFTNWSKTEVQSKPWCVSNQSWNYQWWYESYQFSNNVLRTAFLLLYL